VKAGKSTFINAFLGEDLAKVGTTETMATINYFRYGKITSDKPVHCFWRGGQDEWSGLFGGTPSNKLSKELSIGLFCML
jgi:hypothetical protein